MKKVYKIVLLSLFGFLFVNSVNYAQDEFAESKTTIGGYGEMHYNYKKADNKDATKTLDFHRFVLFVSHTFNEKWSFKSEVELEHNFVSGGNGELELEQAYVNYHHADWFGFQAGVVLNSAGLINEFHEPPLFLGTERPDYNKYIIPTTWFGNGVAIYGNYEGFNYKLTIMEGLNGDKFSEKSGLRSGRQKGYKANAENLMYNARVDYIGVDGLKAGGSFTYNKAMGDSVDNPFSLIEFHAQYRANNVYADFEYGNVSYDKGNLEKSMGYYFDLGYNVASIWDCATEIVPFFRYSDYNTAASTKAGGDSEKKYHNQKWMVGVIVKPHSNVVFKADYASNKIELGDVKTKYFNLGVGYMF